MSEKVLIVKENNQLKSRIEIDDRAYDQLKRAAEDLAAFNDLAFLCNSYVKAKEDFLSYDFTQFDVREVDMFNMFLNALEAISTNRNLWEAYLKRNYENDDDIYPPKQPKGKKKSCFGLKNSEFYDSCIEFVVAKVLRDMITHHTKPYSEIVYNDDLCRQFIVTKEALLTLGNPNASARSYIANSHLDYYDVVNVIKRAFEITDEINTQVFNFILQKEWLRFITARYTVREHIGIDWQGAYLVQPNPQYPEDHLLYFSQVNISKHAMNAIASIAVQSLIETTNSQEG